MLERKSTSVKTAEDYARKLSEFEDFCKQRRLPIDPQQVGFELAVLDYMESKFLDGFAKDIGEKFKAALEYAHPSLKGAKGLLLPRMAKAIKGWWKAGPTGML